MKRLISAKTITALILLFLGVQPTFANIWTGCATITQVKDYTSYNGTFALTLSPSPASTSGACGSSGVVFAEGTQGVTADTIKNIIAMSLTAFATSQQVTIFYDNSTSSCNAVIVQIGC
jgi:hypothetical protein